MVEREQVRPLAQASHRLSSEDDEVTNHLRRLRRRRCIKCWGCIAAIILVFTVVVVVVLVFTVFRVKDPVIKLNGVTVDKLELINGTTTPRPGVNMSLTADVSVKNPNFSSFRYKNTTTTLFYRGTVIGEARGPPGQAKARRTMKMNVTVEIVPDSVMSNPSLLTDISSGILPMNTYSRVPGRVKILKIVKKHVVVKMNCSIALNITSRSIQEQKCKKDVNL
ncbi:hypothetical protein PVL29_020321 [Vitis rotundifolia]|uniref:Late embryogenesis abundant protein LEA-2 subgroup domain-containing protein n=1 Tax=Vitis rotundifolia TaxID=103349 RepID=A0AA39DDX3_VITRO|nr:hypothetical protein PVL29_020321 [Vitis rotundifolia]